MKTMKAQKTIKVPVHHRTTGKKLSYVDNLTARLTYAVQVFCKILNENDRVPKYRSDVREFSDHVKEETGLSAGFIQQAEDKVLWILGITSHDPQTESCGCTSSTKGITKSGSGR